MESEQTVPISNKNGTKFQIHRAFLLIFSLLVYTLVFFHRNCPSSMSTALTEYFKVSKSQLSLISSMFMWSSAIIQFLIAPFTDIYEPFFILVLFNAISIVGCLLCGFATNFITFVIGRFLIGIGVGPTFLAVNKFTLGWYNVLKYFPILSGVNLGFGGIGTFLASFPLVELEQVVGWRWVFHITTIFTSVVIIVLAFIGRADPTLFGYDNVEGSNVSKAYRAHMNRKKNKNKNMELHDLESNQLHEELNQGDFHQGDSASNPAVDIKTENEFIFIVKTIWHNIIHVVKIGQFWLHGFVTFFQGGLSMAFQSYWSGAWIMDVKHTDKVTMSNISIAFTLGQIIPPLLVPFFSAKIGHIRMIRCQVVIYGLMCIAFAAFNEKIPLGVVALLLFINTASMFIMLPSMNSIIVCISGEDASATGLGVFNVFGFVGASVLQMISAEILKHEKPIAPNVYSWKSYNNAIFYPSIALIVVALIMYGWAKDPFKEKKESSSNKEPESLTAEVNQSCTSEELKHEPDL